MFIKLMIRGVAILFIVALAGPVLADDNLPGGGITALRQGFANPAPTDNPCILNAMVEASGPAVDIGWIKWVSTEIVDLSNPNDPYCTNPPTSAVIEGAFIITAENGDEIYGVYEGVAQIDATTAKITALGHYEITGGSGRFKDREGQGITSISGNFAPPYDFTGKLIAQPTD